LASGARVRFDFLFCPERLQSSQLPVFAPGWIALKLKAEEDAMAITLELKPEVEAELMAQAQAAGLSLVQFLSRELEAIVPVAQTHVPALLPDGTDQWEKDVDEWLDSFPQNPVLHEEAFQRENWYPDRW